MTFAYVRSPSRDRFEDNDAFLIVVLQIDGGA